MKTIKSLAVLLAAAALATACSDNNEDRTKVAVVTFEGAAWTPYVAATVGKTYTGDVATENYVWTDAATSLSSTPIFTDYGESGKFFGGGWIVSSYNSKDLAAYGSYSYDLYVYNAENADAVKGGGHNGSDNFLVGFGNADETRDNRPTLEFADGKARTVKGCYVNSTCYILNIMRNGNAFSPALGDEDEVFICATGYDAAGAETGKVSFSFAKKDKMIDTWTAWDLSSLGEVTKIRFSISGGPENEYGMTTPTYYAIDDVTVEWEE